MLCSCDAWSRVLSTSVRLEFMRSFAVPRTVLELLAGDADLQKYNSEHVFMRLSQTAIPPREHVP